MRKYQFFTAKEIKPRGWLLRQLKIQANGLNGNLDKVWPDVRDSKWVGGTFEGWERAPYWLDGFIPLAYLLDDDDMKARGKRFVDAIIAGQQEDGWICPNGDTPREKYDTWALVLLSKVLTVYYECSGDEKIPPVLLKALKNFLDLLESEKIRLFDWGKHRWFEMFPALELIRKVYPQEEKLVLKLAKILKEQGTDYAKLTDRWKVPLNNWTLDTHIVNLCMMLKSEAISYDLLGEEYKDLAEKLYKVLKKYNGTAVETFTGDECLAGIGATHGTELCAVVELMYAYEWLYAATGDKKWAERLEVVSFNALPATLSDDMWTHQYDQMVNQIDCTKIIGRSPFRTNSSVAHIFGLEPHFGCCTANFGQGWPKLAISSFMKAEDGIVCAVPLPVSLDTEFGGVGVHVELKTDYPFKNSFRYEVTADKKTDLKLYVRIPSFAKKIKTSRKATKSKEMLIFDCFEEKTVIDLSFETEPSFESRPGDMSFVKCGSLVFSLPIKGEWKKVEYTQNNVPRKYPYCDYNVERKSEWRWGFASDSLDVSIGKVDEVPFSSKAPAVKIKTELARVDWKYQDGYTTIPENLPEDRHPIGAAKEMTLIPYGCAKLRMTEMPKVEK